MCLSVPPIRINTSAELIELTLPCLEDCDIRGKVHTNLLGSLVSDFSGNLLAQKIQGIYKESKHDGAYSILLGFGLTCASTGVVSTLSYFYPLLILIPHKLNQIHFSTLPPPLPDYTAPTSHAGI